MSFSVAPRLAHFALSEEKAAARLATSNTGVTREVVSDESLLAQICAGDKEAVSILFRRYGGLVRGIGRRILRDEAEAEDHVQEVFFYIYKKCTSYDSSRGSARSWIVQTSYYMALHRRMHLAARRHYDSIELERSGAEEIPSPDIAGYDRSAEAIFGRRAWHQILLALTLDQWETLRLHFFEGYTLTEIGEKRGQPVNNVRHHYYRGLEKLRKHMLDHEMGGTELP
ncbi:MAG: sigma-70 family RNA polymerase sigma factor [Candidatus Acidiferrales bacterium]